MANFTPSVTANSRVFLIDGEARVDHQPLFESCLKAMGLSQDFGDITKIECPDPSRFGQFIEVGQVRGEISRATLDLVGRYPQNEASMLADFAQKRCSFDAHIIFGTCTNPSDANSFEKRIILKNSSTTTYSTDDLGALGSDENAVINETSSLSIREFYEVLPLGFAVRGGDIVNVEVLDVIVADTASCGDCEDESDGCQKIYAITVTGALGSPTTTADIVYSLDKGATWVAADIDTLGASDDPSALAALSDYIVIVANSTDSIHYVDKSDLDGSTTPAFTEVSTGVVAAGSPNAISQGGSTLWVAGDSGYIYKTTDPTAGLTVVDAGVATSENLSCIDALSDTVIVAGGANGAIIKSTNGTTFQTVTVPEAATINTVLVIDENYWFAGTATGNLYYTLNGGTTWTTKTFTGSGSGVVLDIVAGAGGILFMSHQTATTSGRILQSFDNGYSWIVLPQDSSTLPANDKLNALAACSDDPNFVVGVGLADDATDGFIIVGTD